MTLVALLGEPTKEAAKVAASAGLTILESSVLGAVTILALLLAIASVWKTIKVQDQRAKDLEKFNERMEAHAVKSTETNVEFSAALVSLAQADRDGQELLRNLKQSVDTVVLEAVRRGGPPARSR